MELKIFVLNMSFVVFDIIITRSFNIIITDLILPIYCSIFHILYH